jgi:hypothetical protein
MLVENQLKFGTVFQSPRIKATKSNSVCCFTHVKESFSGALARYFGVSCEEFVAVAAPNL